MKLKHRDKQMPDCGRWTMTRDVFDAISSTIGTRAPEWGGILGSSDGVHIDYYYFDKTARRTGGSYTMDADALNRVIHKWNDDGIRFIGVIHSHPNGVTKPSPGDAELAEHIIESMDVGGELFTPIVQVSPAHNGEIRIYPYTFKQAVQMSNETLTIKSESAVQERKRQLDRIAANRFKRIEMSFSPYVMAKKAVIIVGCGGSREFIETLARTGVSTFYLYDKDVVEDTNIATQGAHVSELGKAKVDVLKERILDINPTAEVYCFCKFVDDALTDEEFAVETALGRRLAKDVLLCGCTDDAAAQLRCELLSRKFGIPYLGAQIYAGGKGHEVVFTYPGLTKACCMCMLGTRYRRIFSKHITTGGSSAGTSVWVTNYLNAVKSFFALCMLCFDEPETLYYGTLRKFADRNYLQTKCAEGFASPAFEPIEGVFRTETDLSLPIGTVAIQQEQEDDCVVCKDAESLAISDTIELLHHIIHRLQEGGSSQGGGLNAAG